YTRGDASDTRSVDKDRSVIRQRLRPLSEDSASVTYVSMLPQPHLRKRPHPLPSDAPTAPHSGMLFSVSTGGFVLR
ncbi:MAG: hypothetical protein K2H18_04965, partial [Muribaculaceae bacterium]|nr:hypothetical protein [Muribaculaceae bacterium]